MSNINFKDIKVSTGSLDIKSNVGKTLTEILSQLQSGAQMIATVVKKSISGETVLNTVYGKMVTDNKFNLARGDVINVKLMQVGSDIKGEVVSINQQKTGDDNLINLKLFSQIFPIQKENIDLVNLFPVDKQNLSIVPEDIKGAISYLNLSKMDETSSLYEVFEDVEFTSQKNIPISLKVISSSMINKDNFIGVISGSDKAGGQLIRTEFGVITSENTEMKIGQKLILSITNLDNKPIVSTFIKAITEFVDNINDNMPNLNEIMKTISVSNHLNRKKHNHGGSNVSGSAEIDDFNLEETTAINSKHHKEPVPSKGSEPLQFNNIIKLMNNSEIKKIISEYAEIKELLQERDDQASDSDWQTIFVPIYINSRSTKQAVKIKKISTQHLQFIIDIKFHENPIQIDGTVIFETNVKKLKSFDMILKSKTELQNNLKEQIINIFSTYQSITGLKGSLVLKTDDL